MGYGSTAAARLSPKATLSSWLPPPAAMAGATEVAMTTTIASVAPMLPRILGIVVPLVVLAGRILQRPGP
jgi:hypothetical protein